MRFLVDESTGPTVARWLAAQHHQVFSVFDQARGVGDDEIIAKAFEEDWILITNDKDFGEKVFRERREHRGIVLLRLGDERASNKITVLRNLFETYSHRLAGNFVVVTDTQIRFAGPIP